MAFFTPRYDPGTVAASVLIATFASFVALDLAKRLRAPQGRAQALAWWVGGSLAMGTGIWSMHFVGMAAYSLPIALGYTHGYTFASWLAGVCVSAIALGIAGQGRLTLRRIAGGALAMGAGICAMHYTGMAALDLAPGIVWNWALVAASALIAVAASAAALVIFLWLPSAGLQGGRLFQGLAALVMGLAIAGMHYTGMAAANVPTGALCLSTEGLSASGLGMLVVGASVVMLGMTLLTSVLDSRLQDQTARLAQSLQTANEQLQSANEQLQRQAFLDALTGLPNRTLFEDRLMRAVARLEHAEARGLGREREQERLAVLFVDLDGFKPVNDSLGHVTGDEVLRQAGQRMRQTARQLDTVARIGGDEFVLLMEHVACVADAVALALRAVEALSQPYEAGGRQIEISASVGIVVYPDQGDRAKLLAQADAAMYAAKRAGGGTYALFEPHMSIDALEQLHLQGELRRAVHRGELVLHYQPKVDGRRGRINGVEALVRWNHPRRGLLAPVAFIPLAERFGLINEIGNWVIDEVCRQIAAWADEGVRMRVAVNLSVHQLRQEDLVARVRQALDRHAVDASQLLCEITESVAMEDVKTTQRAFEGLAGLGVFLSIDDFGTGYSSLSYLRQLPARQIKIDRSFVNDLAASADARAVVDAVIKLAHALGLRVVAEGVETEAQRDILLQLGCDELQGFYFARPMEAATLLAWTHGAKPAGSVDFAPSVIGSEI
jgi:diguanylate cyclase (GGDEF)-like protein